MIRLSRKNRPRNSNGDGDNALPAIPKEVKWVLMLLVMMFLPQKASWFEFVSNPQQAYAELRFELPGRTIIVGKNVSSRKIALLAKPFELHICRLVNGKTTFAAHLPGVIPPASYSIAIITTLKSKALGNVRMEDDSEFEPQQLRITTPIEEDQYIIAALVVTLLSAAVAVRLRDYYREDNAAMTGRRS